MEYEIQAFVIDGAIELKYLLLQNKSRYTIFYSIRSSKLFFQFNNSIATLQKSYFEIIIKSFLFGKYFPSRFNKIALSKEK